MKRYLSILAALFLLLRPLCDVWAAGADLAIDRNVAQSSACDITQGANSHQGDPCCARVAKDVIAKVSEPGAVRGGMGVPALKSATAWLQSSYAGAAAASIRKLPGAPPTLSFYARSTRILR
jgi:hypothetical protein